MVQYQGAVLDASFAALSDATRRGVLEQLCRADASITELAGRFRMSLTGMKKHIEVLEQAGLEDEVELTVVDGEIRISAAPEPETGVVLAALSEDSLGDWNRPEEDAAWASLQ